MTALQHYQTPLPPFYVEVRSPLGVESKSHDYWAKALTMCERYGYNIEEIKAAMERFRRIRVERLAV